MKTKLIIIIGLAAAIHVQADTNFFEILTCGGDTYTNATITQVTPAYVTLTYDGGVAQLPLRDLPENVQQQYHYNSNAAAQFRLEQKEKSRQLRAAEAARRTAAVRQAADEAAKAAQFARSPAGLDAEVKQMRAAGWIEFTSDLILNFPEKVRDQIPGDGTIIHKRGWMDATFESFNNDSGDQGLPFSVDDSTGHSFFYCLVPKKLYKKEVVSGLEIAAGYVDEGTPNPLADVAFKLKHGDKVRLFGYCDDAGGLNERLLNERLPECVFHVEKIEMIETAAEKKAREQAGEKP